MNRSILLVVLGVVALFRPGAAEAQNAIPFDVTGGGGGHSSQGGVHLQDTIGEAAIGMATSPANVHGAGYWYCVDGLHIGPTSAVVITAFDASVSTYSVDLGGGSVIEKGLKGFNIYRSGERDARFERINESLLMPGAEFTFIDTRIRPGTTYWYRLGVVDRDGEYLSPVTRVATRAARTALHQNFPNPFNPETTISFYLARRGPVDLTIFDTQGKRVRRLIAGEMDFGSHEVVWDGRNDRGEEIGSGVYFCRLAAGKNTQTRKLTFLK